VIKKDKLVLIRRGNFYKKGPVAKWHKKLPPVKKGPLTRDQIAKFYKEGFLVIDEFFTKK
jgi:regulator of replication initiation timing